VITGAAKARLVKVDASDPKAVARTLAIIKLLYEVHKNSSSPLYHVRRNVRFHDLEKVFAHCWRGAELPDDDAGRDHLYIAACHIWHLGKKCGPIATLKAWAAQWAPWCGPDELQALIDRVDANPRKWTADELAHELGLYVLPFSVRQALGITTIGSIDVDKEGRQQRRAANSTSRSETRRREGGAVPRSEWLLANNANHTEPWAALGISRRTYYRRRATEAQGGTGPNAAKIGDILVCSDQCHDRSPDGISVPPVPPVSPAFDRGPPAAAPSPPPRPIVIRLDGVPGGLIIDEDGHEFEAPPPYERRPPPKTWMDAAFEGYRGRS
jgi:hypothetical protein